MTTLKFSMKTDIWAYGIVLLEMAENGRTPLHGLINSEVMARIQSGYIPPQPQTCTDVLYGLMKDCWHIDPAERPTFQDICARLEDDEFQDADHDHRSEMGSDIGAPEDENNYMIPGGAPTRFGTTTGYEGLSATLIKKRQAQQLALVNEGLYGFPVRTAAFFRQKRTPDDAIGTHTCSLQALYACDQSHSSRLSTFLTGSHCKMRPNTKGCFD
jgi:serine/threonine protein kinase